MTRFRVHSTEFGPQTSSPLRGVGSPQTAHGGPVRRGDAAICPRLSFRVDILVEKLRREEHFVDKPAHRAPIYAVGDGQLAFARRDQDAMDAVGEFEMRCVRLLLVYSESRSMAFLSPSWYALIVLLT